MHKLLIVSVYIHDLNLFKLLIDSFLLSPFAATINDLTAFHYACYKGYNNIVKFCIDTSFVFYKSQRVFSIKEMINKRRGEDMNTCLHLASMQTRIQTFDILIANGANINRYNYQDFRPLDLTKNETLNKKEEFLFDQYENKQLVKVLPNIKASDTFNEMAMQLINENFHFFLATIDVEEDPLKTLVYS